MRKLTEGCLALAAMVVATSCATKVVRTYPGEQLSPDQVAILHCHREFGGSSVLLESVDGAVPGQGFRYAEEVELRPGEHTVQVSYTDFDSHSTSNARLTFAAEPGGRYELRGARLKSGFWSEIGKKFQSYFWPASGRWVVWVVDTRTGAVVAGKEPQQGLFKTAVAP